MDAIEKRALDQLAQLLQSGGFEGELRVGREFGKALVAEIAALTPPEGYVLVPVEPTEAMVDRATWEEVGGHCSSCTAWAASPSDARRVWAAMLAARPEVKP